jgi:gamma-glutamyltranspeptidase / glutathione hydrolase
LSRKQGAEDASRVVSGALRPAGFFADDQAQRALGKSTKKTVFANTRFVPVTRLHGMPTRRVALAGILRPGPLFTFACRVLHLSRHRSVVAALTLGAVIPSLAVANDGVASRNGLVVSACGIASDAGAAVLSRGGNAVDAAVATAFALAVTYPAAGNIGGGGFMIVRTPDKRATAFDYREVAPLRASPTMYLGKNGEIDRSLTRAGYLAPGVPGTVSGMALAHRRFGKLPWKDVVLPAVELAERGFILAPSLASALNGQVRGAMAPFPASVAAYGRPDGKPWLAGDRIVLPDLARSLRAIAAEGPDAFYKGWIADRIAGDMAANGGLISKADLAAYQAKERTPIRGTFLGYDIISMPPPSSGGVALVQMLNTLEALDIQRHPHGSAAAVHLMAEAMRRAYLDRARHLGDPDFVDVPVARLTDKAYARELARTIDTNKASSSIELGKSIVTVAARREAGETTHFSVIDRDGMAVSNTYTLEGSYGSHVVIRGTGILLNNEMGDFNKKPGTTNLTGDIGTPANLIAPGKRMLSSMTPTIVERDGRVVLITGTPGGRTIINSVLNIVVNVAAWGMDGRQAIDAPRLHHQWLPDQLTLEAKFPADTAAALKALGHHTSTRDQQGSAQSIWIDPASGTPHGIADHRGATAKASAALRP